MDQNGDGYPDGVLQNTLNRGNPIQEGYFLYQGTSMATPHVAALAALLFSAGKSTPDQVEQTIPATAKKPENKYSKEHYGAGIINVDAALAAALHISSKSQRESCLRFFLDFFGGMIVFLLQIPILGLIKSLRKTPVTSLAFDRFLDPRSIVIFVAAMTFWLAAQIFFPQLVPSQATLILVPVFLYLKRDYAPVLQGVSAAVISLSTLRLVFGVGAGSFGLSPTENVLEMVWATVTVLSAATFSYKALTSPR